MYAKFRIIYPVWPQLKNQKTMTEIAIGMNPGTNTGLPCGTNGTF